MDDQIKNLVQEINQLYNLNYQTVDNLILKLMQEKSSNAHLIEVYLDKLLSIPTKESYKLFKKLCEYYETIDKYGAKFYMNEYQKMYGGDIASNVILGTGSYSSVKGGNTVSVTGDGGNAWNYYGSAYKKLAPRLVTYLPYAEKYEQLLLLKQNKPEYVNYRKQIEDEYINSYYETRLKDLDVIDLIETLNQKFGNNIILLCHEPVNEFCHRRLIADYIELKTGIYIPEVSVSKQGVVTKTNPIRYKKKLKRIIDNVEGK